MSPCGSDYANVNQNNLCFLYLYIKREKRGQFLGQFLLPLTCLNQRTGRLQGNGQLMACNQDRASDRAQRAVQIGSFQEERAEARNLWLFPQNKEEKIELM